MSSVFCLSAAIISSELVHVDIIWLFNFSQGSRIVPNYQFYSLIMEEKGAMGQITGKKHVLAKIKIPKELKYEKITKVAKKSYSFPSNVVLAQEYKGPLKKKKRHVDTREKAHKVWKAKSGSAKGKLSKSNAEIMMLPPIIGCLLKTCKFECGYIKKDRAYQSQLRKLYYDTVKNSDSIGHTKGNKLLATMCRPCYPPIGVALKIVKVAQGVEVKCAYCRRFPSSCEVKGHILTESSCPRWIEAMQWYKEEYKPTQHEFFLPVIDADGNVLDTNHQVHRGVFQQIFQLGWQRFRSIYDILQDNTSPQECLGNGWSNNVGQNKIADELVKKILTAHS